MMATARPQEQFYSVDTLSSLLPRPTIPGIIRATTADFKVREYLDFELLGDGEHLYLDVTKEDANTGWVAHQLAEHLAIKDQDVGFAGRKDRHAISRQWFSCYLPKRNESREDSLTAFSEPGVTVHSATRHRQKLRRGQIKHNEFELTVRHHQLTSIEQQDLLERAEQLKKGFPNYFGYQRFGFSGENLHKADQLLRLGEKVTPRSMVISAARGWLFNLYLSDDVAHGAIHEGAGPLIGKSRDPQPGEAELPEQLQAWVAGLRKLGAKVDERKLYVQPGNFSIDLNGDETHLSFNLPSGSYATSLLRELFIVEDAQREQ